MRTIVGVGAQMLADLEKGGGMFSSLAADRTGVVDFVDELWQHPEIRTEFGVGLTAPISGERAPNGKDILHHHVKAVLGGAVISSRR